MNKRFRDGGTGGQYPEVIGEHVKQLLDDLAVSGMKPDHKTELQKSLYQLTDLKFALDESSIVAITDSQGKITYVNDKFCHVSGYSRDELHGQDHRIINSGHHSRDFFRELWRTISRGSVWKGEIKNRAKDGSYYWVNTTIVPFLDAAGRPEQYLAIRTEVTELKRVEEELQHMMTRMMRIQEEERKRLSRELHDGIGQSLFSLLISIDRMNSDGQSEELQELREQVTHIIEDIRSISWELRPSVLDDLGIVPAIRSYVQSYMSHYGIDIHLQCSLKRRLDVQVETTIYRIIQEALTNISKYADVADASVTIEEGEHQIVVRIEDAGRGFTPDNRSSGVGLFSMEERARAVGGRLSIQSAPGMGTQVCLTIPQ